MTKETMSPMAEVINDGDRFVFNQWMEEQLADKNRNQGISDSSLKTSSAEFFKLFQEAASTGNFENLATPQWEALFRMLGELSASRAIQGSSPTETANFVFSLKKPLFEKLNTVYGQGNVDLQRATWVLSLLFDKLGMFTAETFQKSREAVIRRQQRDIMEMATPVIKMWDGVLAVPLIGTLDSARTQIVMENLLQKIAETGAKIAILDITGVPTVDTQTAQHLIKTVSASRLMGANCIISGIRPQIAQTIVHLGIDIYDITTKATMEDALKEALALVGWAIVKDVDSDRDR